MDHQHGYYLQIVEEQLLKEQSSNDEYKLWDVGCLREKALELIARDNVA